MKKPWVFSYPLSASKDSDQAGRTLILLVLSCRGSFVYVLYFILSFLEEIKKSVYLCFANESKEYLSRVMKFSTFRPPKTHSSNAHTQPSSGARCLIVGRTLRLLPYFMCANSEGSGETAWMRRLA